MTRDDRSDSDARSQTEAEAGRLEPGSIAWRDLTTHQAPELRDFYAQVVGWQPTEVPMGDYVDFSMNLPQSGEAMAGICHAQGVNRHLPAQWLIYIIVANLNDSIERCTELGGAVLAGPKGMGGQGRYCVIRDPSGAVCALFEQT